MIRKHPSKQNLLKIIYLSVTAAAMLAFLLWANLFSASAQAMLQEEFPAAKTSGLSAGELADRLFVCIVPIVIIILVYVAFIITRLVYDLGKLAVCEQTNPDCGHDSRRFSRGVMEKKRRTGFNGVHRKHARGQQG